jgi:surface glycoprotein (TIGR04207 family)/PGF-CTERM protein
MTRDTTVRQKGQAVFFAAIMVLSVVAVGMSFAGAAAADSTSTSTLQSSGEISIDNVFLNESSDKTTFSKHAEGAENVKYTFDVSVSSDAKDKDYVSIDLGDADVSEIKLDDIDFSNGIGSGANDELIQAEDGLIIVEIGDNTDITNDFEVDVVDVQNPDNFQRLPTAVGLHDEESSNTPVTPANVTAEQRVAIAPTSSSADTTVSATNLDGEDFLDDENVLVTGLESGVGGSFNLDNAYSGSLNAGGVGTADVVADEDTQNGSEVNLVSDIIYGNRMLLDTSEISDSLDDNDLSAGSNIFLFEDGINARSNAKGTAGPFGLDSVSMNTFQFASSNVAKTETATLQFAASAATYDLEISESNQGLSASQLESAFQQTPDTVDSENDVIIFNDVADGDDLTLDTTNLNVANYTFDGKVVNTGATGSADLEVGEEVDGSVNVNPGILNEQQGGIATFDVNFSSVQSADVTISAEGLYKVTIENVEPNDDGTATIRWNTFAAGLQAAQSGTDPNQISNTVAVGSSSVISMAEGSAGDVNETKFGQFANDANLKLPQGEYRVNADAGGVTDIGRIRLRSVDNRAVNAIAHTAPAADLDSNTEFSDIPSIATPRSAVADGDTVVYAFEAQGVLGGLLTDADDANNIDAQLNTNEGYSVRIEAVDSAFGTDAELDGSENGVGVLAVPQSDQFFVTMDTTAASGPLSNVLSTSGNTYNVSFEVDGDNSYAPEGTGSSEVFSEAGAEFTLEDPTLTITGPTDDQDRIQVPAQETELTADTNLAPGTDIITTVEAKAAAEDQFAASPRGEVGEDGIAIAFDASNRQQGDPFTISMEDAATGEISDSADAVFGEGPGGPNFQVTGLQPQEAEVEAGTTELSVSATISNQGGSEGTVTPQLRLDSLDQPIATGDNITLGAGEEQEVSFTADPSQLSNGSYTHKIVAVDANGEVVAEQSGSFTLGGDTGGTGDDGDGGDGDGGDGDGDDGDGGDGDGGDGDGGDGDGGSGGQPGFGVAVGLLAILGAAFLALRRQQ